MKTTFLGYERPKGKVGVRNYIAVIPSVSCAADTATKIASHVTGAVAIMNNTGCDEVGIDLAQTLRTLAGFGKNPNIAAVLVIGLGCEVLSPHKLTEEIRKEGKPVECLVIQEVGGTIQTIEKGVTIAQNMAEKVSKIVRRRFNASYLMIGTQCGASDATSGIAANPALGVASDNLIKLGGVSILAETSEMIGAEHWLTKRAVNQKVADRIDFIVRRFEKRMKGFGEDWVGKQPSPGNIEGGLSTIEEKSLGCVAKGGSAPIQGVLEYGDIPQGKGLYIMDTPGNDIESNTALVAGGCQILCFTTGAGSPVGSPITPVIKITGNPHTYETMNDNIDISAGGILQGEKSIREMGKNIFCEIMAVASGKWTKAEILGCREFCINRLGPSY